MMDYDKCSLQCLEDEYTRYFLKCQDYRMEIIYNQEALENAKKRYLAYQNQLEIINMKIEERKSLKKDGKIQKP